MERLAATRPMTSSGSKAMSNGDRTVNIVDFFQFRNAFGNPDSFNAAVDVNGDGVTNIVDFFQFRS
jgi:glutamine amidotransferase PdxT